MEETYVFKQPSALKLFKGFGENTTMHGVRRAFYSKSLWKRIVWSVLVLFAIAFGFSRFLDVINDYYKYPVTTVVSLNHEKHIVFPAITICNMNSVRSSKIPQRVKNNIYVAQSDDDDQDTLNAEIRYMASDVRINAGHHMTDMLISCRFNRQVCTVDNFTELYTGLSGNCHTFNLTSENLLIGRPGPQNGLILEMSLEHNEYISMSTKAGVNVIVHDITEAPFPEDGGISVSPGMATSIALKKTITHRLPPPYGSCVPAGGDSSEEINLFSNLSYAYTENACRKSCYQLSLYEECKCCDIDLPCDLDKIFKVLNITPKNPLPLNPFCNTASVGWKCVSRVESKFFQGHLNCSERCSPACDQTTFGTVVSTALWPTDPYMKILLERVNQTVLENMKFRTPEALREYVLKNFMRLEIFFETLDSLEVITKPMYDWSNLLGDLGGHLGLCLGFSILTGLEVVELILDTALIWIPRLKRKAVAKKNKIPLDQISSKSDGNVNDQDEEVQQ